VGGPASVPRGHDFVNRLSCIAGVLAVPFSPILCGYFVEPDAPSDPTPAPIPSP
jgi:hypothetical protein